MGHSKGNPATTELKKAKKKKQERLLAQLRATGRFSSLSPTPQASTYQNRQRSPSRSDESTLVHSPEPAPRWPRQPDAELAPLF